MSRHDVVCLEEAATPVFNAMLSGRISIDEYLPETGTEYPLFTLRSCRGHRRLHGQGKTIFQIEPYLETLLKIQLRLADGATPAEMASRLRYASVYAAEKAATGAALAAALAPLLLEQGFTVVGVSRKPRRHRSGHGLAAVGCGRVGDRAGAAGGRGGYGDPPNNSLAAIFNR